MREEKLCPRCDEPACFCPEGVKEPSVQWSGMFEEDAAIRAMSPYFHLAPRDSDGVCQDGDAKAAPVLKHRQARVRRTSPRTSPET